MKNVKDWTVVINDEITNTILPGTVNRMAELIEHEIQRESDGWRYIAKWNGRMLTEAYREIARLQEKVRQLEDWKDCELGRI
jgi:hypothetical protein